MWYEQNECGLWCDACGAHIAASPYDDDMGIPDSCPICGHPEDVENV